MTCVFLSCPHSSLTRVARRKIIEKVHYVEGIHVGAVARERLRSPEERLEEEDEEVEEAEP